MTMPLLEKDIKIIVKFLVSQEDRKNKPRGLFSVVYFVI